MCTISAMPTMHKRMQQRTSKQQQEGQRPEQVGAVLSQQKKRRDGEKSQHGQVDLACVRVPMRSGKLAFHGVTFAYRD